jgi:TolA-binding protein
VWAAYIIQVFTALLAVMTLAKDWGAHQSSWRRTGVGFLIISLMVVSAYNTYHTGKHNAQQHQEDEGKIAKLQASVDTANKGQSDNTRQFLQQISNLSDKVAKLQTQAATEALQKQAAQLQAEVRSTEQALNPPKAELQFSFDTQGDVRVRTLSLSPDSQGNIAFRFTVMNLTPIAATDGFIVLQFVMAVPLLKCLMASRK